VAEPEDWRRWWFGGRRRRGGAVAPPAGRGWTAVGPVTDGGGDEQRYYEGQEWREVRWWAGGWRGSAAPPAGVKEEGAGVEDVGERRR
jgi:hypothetical protein